MKSITVVPDRMTLTQRREAYLFAEKHQRDFSRITKHSYEGVNGTYNVSNLKQITVRLAQCGT